MRRGRPSDGNGAVTMRPLLFAILSLWSLTAGAITKPSFGRIPDRNLPVSSRLEGAWILNEGSGTVAYDSSGNGNNGTFITGTVPPAWTTGAFGPAVSFPPAGDTSGINIARRSSVVGTYTTLSAFKLSHIVNTSHAIMGISGNNTGLLNVSNTVIKAYNGLYLTSSVAADTSTEFIVIVTSDGAGNGSITVNGTSTTGAIGTYTATTAGAIGNGGSGLNWSMDGVLDAVMVWSRVLTAPEIAALTANPFYFYRAPLQPKAGTLVNKAAWPGVVAAYAFNDGLGQVGYAGTTLADTSGVVSPNNGSITLGSGGWVIGTYGSAILFDGSASVIAATKSASILTSNPETTVILARTPATLPTNEYLFDLGTNQRNIAVTSSSGKFVTAGSPQPASQGISVNTDYVVVFASASTTGAGTIYTNGTAGTSGTSTDGGSAASITIGNYGGGGSYYWNSTISGVLMFSRTPTPTEIAKLNADPYAPWRSSGMIFGPLGSIKPPNAYAWLGWLTPWAANDDITLPIQRRSHAALN